MQTDLSRLIPDYHCLKIAPKMKLPSFNRMTEGKIPSSDSSKLSSWKKSFWLIIKNFISTGSGSFCCQRDEYFFQLFWDAFYDEDADDEATTTTLTVTTVTTNTTETRTATAMTTTAATTITTTTTTIRTTTAMMRLTTIFHKSCIFVKKEEKIRDFLTWKTCVRLDDIIETAWTKESCRFKSDWFSFKQKMMSHLLYLSLTLSYPTITLSFRLSVSVSLSSDVSLWLVSLPKFPYFSSCLRLSLCTLIHLALSPIPLFLYLSVYFHMERELHYRACSYFKSIWFSPFTSKQCLKSILPKSLIQRQYLFMNIIHGVGQQG